METKTKNFSFLTKICGPVLEVQLFFTLHLNVSQATEQRRPDPAFHDQDAKCFYGKHFYFQDMSL